MRRAVLVCGIGGSGTSAVAGALHLMGCPMGHEAHFRRHPAGFALYEDQEFYGAFRQQGRMAEDALRALIAAHQRDPVWGWKNTLTVKAFPWLIPLLRDLGNEPRVVAVHRTLTASIHARVRGRCPPGRCYQRAEAEAWAVRALRLYAEALDVVQSAQLCRVHHVGYEDVMADPQLEVERLAGVAFEGLSPPDTTAAMAHIGR